MDSFEGVYAVIPTPFTADDEVDEAALGRLVEDLVGRGVHGIICNGSTGEVFSLADSERQRVLEATIARVGGRVPVLAGGSANATRHAIGYSRAAARAGAAGVMVVHPHYALPSERELERHYRDLAQAVSIPIMIYNNPWTTGVDAKPALLARLAEAEPNIRYVKESSSDVARVGQILARTDKLIVFCGWDNIALESFVAGARGWVSGAANLIPDEAVQLFTLAVRDGDWRAAQVLNRRIIDLMTALETSGKFLQYIKAGLALRGLAVGAPRAPLLPPTDAEMAEYRRLYQMARGALAMA